MKQLTADQQELLDGLQERHGLDRFAIAEDPSPAPAARPRSEQLSLRELEVLVLMADGLENSEIARELYLAIETIKTHGRSLRAKLRARNRTHAVAIAYRSGLLEP